MRRGLLFAPGRPFGGYLVLLSPQEEASSYQPGPVKYKHSGIRCLLIIISSTAAKLLSKK